ncbi:LMBR1-like protein lilipod isoform X1 [Leptinotarsa decemlineata]|uniref:LMBR1-like protein lilipod isoform X1 n=1 Tax=Leptinotarsa decemlineata TaxID=7539 RepID=UPI003D306CC5
MEEYDGEESDLTEQSFHNNVREQIIFLLLFLLLYLLSFALLGRFKRTGREDYFSNDEDEVTVYRFSTWLCTFSLAVSIGAVLLLPVSIVANEVLVNYPNSYYIKWLNSSLIQGLWNYVFLFSNLSLFIFLPFTYLFTESEGFFGHRKGILSRVYETSTVLALLGVIVLGLTYVISALIDKDNSSIQTILNLWTYYLPFLYSCISFLGVLILLVCTPIGFVRLFDVVGQFLIKPQFLRDINEEYDACALEEEFLRRRLKHAQKTGKSYGNPASMIGKNDEPIQNDDYKLPDSLFRNGELQSRLGKRLTEIEKQRKLLGLFSDKQRHTSSLRRNVIYPVAMLLLLGVTILAVLLVLQNTLSLLIGMKALPISSKQFTLGVSSLSKLGPFGAALEIVLIIYMILTSSVGLYTIPCMKQVRPKPKSTPFIVIIGNCVLLLIISSALPLLSKILGITNFDLLGDFGSIEWLGNFKIVLLYNLSFAATSTLCVINKFTAKVRRELYNRLLVVMKLNKRPPYLSTISIRKDMSNTPRPSEENDFWDAIHELPINERSNLIVQLDGCSVHYARAVRQWLNEHFPNRWIGRGSSFIEWPPRSPDLTVLDFFPGDFSHKRFTKTAQEIEMNFVQEFDRYVQILALKN